MREDVDFAPAGEVEPGPLGRDLVQASVIQALAKHATAPTTPGGGGEELKALRDWIASMNDAPAPRADGYFAVADVLLEQGR